MGKPIKKRPKESPHVPAAPPAKRVKVRELRAHLKEYLALGAPIIIGSPWRPKAVILPVAESWEYGEQARRVRAQRLKALFAAAIKFLDY